MKNPKPPDSTVACHPDLVLPTSEELDEIARQGAEIYKARSRQKMWNRLPVFSVIALFCFLLFLTGKISSAGMFIRTWAVFSFFFVLFPLVFLFISLVEYGLKNRNSKHQPKTRILVTGEFLDDIEINKRKLEEQLKAWPPVGINPDSMVFDKQDPHVDAWKLVLIVSSWISFLGAMVCMILGRIFGVWKPQ